MRRLRRNRKRPQRDTKWPERKIRTSYYSYKKQHIKGAKQQRWRQTETKHLRTKRHEKTTESCANLEQPWQWPRRRNDYNEMQTSRNTKKRRKSNPKKQKIQQRHEPTTKTQLKTQVQRDRKNYNMTQRPERYEPTQHESCCVWHHSNQYYTLMGVMCFLAGGSDQKGLHAGGDRGGGAAGGGGRRGWARGIPTQRRA